MRDVFKWNESVHILDVVVVADVEVVVDVELVVVDAVITE